MTLENIVLILGGTLTGLLAGVFYAFNVAVVPALRSIKGTQHIAAMQAINIKIKNPVFFLSFFGPTILLPLAAYLHRDGPQFATLVAAAILHIIGANAVTVVGNIPLNDKLEKIDVSRLSEAQADEIRQEFQGIGSSWMRYHNVRTLAETAATILVFIVCLSKKVTE
ncbi:MAG: anthrone oxygenase family protein [Chloroflexota bacterium]